MKNTLERLRQMKSKAVEWMQALNARTKKENRDLTEDERLEYELKRDAVVELNAAIATAEAEFLVAAPAVVPAAAPTDDPDYYYGRRSLASMSIAEWSEALRREAADAAQQSD